MKPALKWLLVILLLLNATYVGIQYVPLVQSLKLPTISELLGWEIPSQSMTNFIRSYIATPEDVIYHLNIVRSNQNLDTLETDDQLCTILSPYLSFNQTPEDLINHCPGCQHLAVVQISSLARPNLIVDHITRQEVGSTVLGNAIYSHVCIIDQNAQFNLLFAGYAAPTASQPAVFVTPRTTTVQLKPKNFTEEELWVALTEYRRAHRRTTLSQDENLCQYARRRVDEHILNYATMAESNYPVPDKYPLDAHAGFRRDGDSNLLFDITKMKLVGENLAYWPSAEYSHQVIEWGWDTSTEGHREAQLSEDFTHACLSGREGFFVAIFGKS